MPAIQPPSQSPSASETAWAFDDATIRRIVGVQSYERGRLYAARGAVRLTPGSPPPTRRDPLIAHVAGSGRAPYTVIVTGRSGTNPASGSCSCPMRTNCKHVAATLLTVAEAARSHRAASWERRLEGLTLSRARTHQSPGIALQFELSAWGGPAPSLRLRPIVRMRNGNWTRSGAGWASLRYNSRQRELLPEEVIRLFEEVPALASTGPHTSRWGYAGYDAAIRLETFPTPRIWDTLRDLRNAGVLFMTTEDQPVVLHEETATASLDITESEAALKLTPEITIGGAALRDVALCFIGDHPHGVAWLPSGSEPQLHLARFDHPLADTAREALGSTTPLVVPSRDRGHFLAGVYPALRNTTRLTSRDNSFSFPQTAVRLVARCTHVTTGELLVEWEWEYATGDHVRRVPISLRDDAAGHATAEQDSILEELLPIAAQLPALVVRAWDALELAPTASLRGMEVVTFTREIQPALEALDDVRVIVEGDAPDFHEVTDAPAISFEGEPGVDRDWLDLNITVTVGRHTVEFAPLFRALARDERHLVLPDGAWFSLDRPEFGRLRELIREAETLGTLQGSTLRVSRFQADLWSELEELGTVSAQAAAWGVTLRALRDIAELPPAPLPDNLNATLRPYQRVGYDWLTTLQRHGLGGILADDMGLGKTLQALAMVLRARQDEPGAAPFLVVAPTSVVSNWAAEARRFTPSLRVAAITETRRRRGETLADLAESHDLIVTSYAIFRIDFEEYEKSHWSGLILDEAQAVKNHHARGYTCARRLTAPVKLAITGTPMENNLMELWAIFSIVAPGLFPRPERFAEEYRTPIEREGDQERLALLRRRIGPLLIRRTKDEVAPELPARIEQTLDLDLNPRHRRFYQTLLQRERQHVLGLLGDVKRNRFEILRSLTLLRQASIDPALVDEGQGEIDSTKLDALMAQVEEIVQEGHRALIFSQFTRFLGRVRAALDRAGISYCYLDGRTTHRDTVIDRFKNGDDPLFLISLKAGGVGLNLVEADYCILLDPWWNPATEAQAIDRAHRIGQTRNVMVYRYISRDTIEEKVMSLQASKAELFRSVLAEGVTAAAKLTADDIRRLLS